MINGSCYCGAVRYEIHGKVLNFLNCHCPDCRKMTGAAFSSVLIVQSEGFIVVGEENLVPYQSSPGKQRCFCKTCGCHLFSRVEHRQGMVFVKAGSLDDDPHMKPQVHFWTSVKAPWHDITDSIPRHMEGIGSEIKNPTPRTSG
jgi:hypothetical protein